MKNIFCILLGMTIFSGYSQVRALKVGDNAGVMAAPSSTVMELESTTKGLLITRVANTAAIASPVNGMLIYDNSLKCFRVYQKGLWMDCGLNTTVVQSITGKIWMDRDLGATRVAVGPGDYLAFGDLYQWGRGRDGHQLNNWTSATTGTLVNGYTATLSTTDTPGHKLFIILGPSGDWRSPGNNNLWQGVNGINNPCPAGFRVPNISEFAAEITAYAITDAATAYNSVFKFPNCAFYNASGYPQYSSVMMYWTSSVYGVDTGFHFQIGFGAYYQWRAVGEPVRCIKD